MNKRIQELARQAGYNGHYATEEFDVDLFAEMIIQECTKFLDEKSDHDDFVAKVAPLLRKN